MATAMTVSRDDVLRFRVADPAARPAPAPDAGRRASSTSASRTPVRTAHRLGTGDPGRRPSGRGRCSSPGRCAARRTPTGGRRRRRSPRRSRRGARRTPRSGSSTPRVRCKKAGIPVLDALDHIAGEMRDDRRDQAGRQGRDVERAHRPARRAVPALVQRLRGDAHLRAAVPAVARCRPGLELEPGTSPPVLRRIPRLAWAGEAGARRTWTRSGRCSTSSARPTPKLVAGYVDSPVKEVKARWPEDVVPVEVDGRSGSTCSPTDADALAGPPTARRGAAARPVRPVPPGPRPRAGRPGRRRPARTCGARIGRPGGVLAGHEVVGTWRPRTKGKKLRLLVTIWDGVEAAGRESSRKQNAWPRSAARRSTGYED